MESISGLAGSRFWRAMRWVVWGGAACVLMLPAVAMRFTTEVNWTASDFVVMGTMLALAGGAFEVVVRSARSHAYVMAAGIAVLAAFLMTWANLAVGIIGDEHESANGLFFGVLALAGAGVAIARLQSQAMAQAMLAAAIAQVLVAVVALVLGGILVFALTMIFVVMWLASAQLFRIAARQETAAR